MLACTGPRLRRLASWHCADDRALSRGDLAACNPGSRGRAKRWQRAISAHVRLLAHLPAPTPGAHHPMNLHRLARALSVLLTLGTATLAHADLAQPRLVRVRLGAGLTVAKLLEAGLDIVEVKGTSEAHLLEWPGDEIKLIGLAATSEVLDAYPGRTAALRARAELVSRPAPNPTLVRSAVGPDGV